MGSRRRGRLPSVRRRIASPLVRVASRRTAAPALSAPPSSSALPPTEPELCVLHRWLDSWAGIGLIAVGMARQGYDLQLTRYDERGWRATFYTTGMEHSPTSATGTAWERTPWLATQRAAWGALKATD
jgi:hypothetical protein